MLKKAIILILALILVGCSQPEVEDPEQAQPEVNNIEETIELSADDQIQQFKNIEIEEDITLGNIFDAGMEETSYEIVDSQLDDTGYLNVHGMVYYMNMEIEIIVQYFKDEENNYDFHELIYNGDVQNQTEIKAYFKTMTNAYKEQVSEQ